MQSLTYKVNEGQLLTHLLFITFAIGLFNLVWLFNVNINLIVTFLLGTILLIKSTIFSNRMFIVCMAILFFFLLLKIDYYSVYFLTYYLTIIFSFFIGLYSPYINLPDFFKKLFILSLVFNIVYYLTVHSPFVIEDLRLRLISISGGPPSTSFIYLCFFIVFYNYKMLWWWIAAFILIILTGNRITILTAVSLIALSYLLNLSLKKILIVTGILFALAIVVFSTHFDIYLLKRARFLDDKGNWNLHTFEGRMVHWKWAIIHFRRASLWHKFFGYGINATKEIFFTTHTYNGEHTGSGAMHNEYLRILVENGIAGLIIIFTMLFSFIRSAFKSKNRFIILALTASLVVTATTDNILYSYFNYLTILFFLLGYHLKHSTANHAKV